MTVLEMRAVLSEVLLASLRALTETTIQAAGPRYSPAFRPGAPNLHIGDLERAVTALCLSGEFRRRVADIATEIRANRAVRDRTAAQLFRGRSVEFDTITADLEGVAAASSATQIRAAFHRLRRHTKLVRSTIAAGAQQVRDLRSATPESELNAPTGPARPTRGEEYAARLSSLADLDAAVAPVSDVLDETEGRTAPGGDPVLLLGEWGTGKTHFVCDFALSALADGVPAVAVLAPMLDGGEPLDELADQLGLASSAELLDQLEDAARTAGRRAIIMIDAINEGDRPAWRRRLPALIRAFAGRTDVSLLLTCRTPFEQQLLTERQQNRFLTLHHLGFEDQEFDAQLEFFDFYQLPALHVPLLSAEFARPLFLKLLCEGLVRLSTRKQKQVLDGIASGQKGMTFVLENFVTSIGVEVSDRHELPKTACWYLLKGREQHGYPGLAGRLADLRREWLSPAEVVQEVDLQFGLTGDAAAAFLRDMVSSGLLVEQLRYQDGGYQEALALPYQRFSDHLVARHLLATHLDTSTITRLRRSFYANRRLGAAFQLDRWGRSFAEPGVASALMVEFPERVKRVVGSAGSTELISYLPKARLFLAPIADAFIEGLYWRDAATFNSDTQHVVGRLFSHEQASIITRLLEVLFGLAARHQHPWNADHLWERLRPLLMATRDLHWSEFLRLSEDTGNVQRLLAWTERPAARSASAQVVRNLLTALALMTTTTDRVLRDRATRSMVYLGERHPAELFGLVPKALEFNDPYVAERVLAAAYGVAMRNWGNAARPSDFDPSLASATRALIATVLAPGAVNGTWHTLTRSYAEGIVEVLHRVQPGLVTRADHEILGRKPLPAESPFRRPEEISDEDTVDGEHTIHMDFGNYTMGRLVDNRSNYDMEFPEYVDIRKQIADRVRRLGYRIGAFEQIDRVIADYSSRRHDGARTDRYGKKYAWIAYFEMYGLRSRTGLIEDYPRLEPRSTDIDIDPSFPVEPPEWRPPMPNTFDASPTDHRDWLTAGIAPDYSAIASLKTAAGHIGDWTLLHASIHDGVPDGREIQAWATTTFVPTESLDVIRTELAARPSRGRREQLAEPGTDFYTFLGEVGWSRRFGSDIRRKNGKPRHLYDRAFENFANGVWQPGLPVEPATRIWGWENHHSSLNQVGSIVFPSPALTDFHELRSVAGSADLVDPTGHIATIFRRAPGPGYGSRFLYVRSDLIDAYAAARSLQLVTVINGERTLHYDYFDRQRRIDLQAIFQSHANDFAFVIGI
ncbi:hypothetical protein [Agromyces mediolanus]|uniref:hypothetical protein n=1 Tax=Agromyces mediolanus TaxID=41986 RepID=UPI001E48F6DB|nr:hypothetical protein [Agromyces mediolanus]MCD1573256.1 hypothetical protein [Agromyces mediolanus]